MVTRQQIVLLFIYILSIGLSIYMSSAIAEGGAGSFLHILTVGAGLGWIIFGGAIWWLPLFLGIGFGGVFYFGFKLYPSECGFGLALASVFPLMLIRRSDLIVPRERLPRILYFFIAYLFLHAGLSCAINSGGNLQNIGSICRFYFNPLWALLFLIMFHLYGRTTHIEWGFYCLQWILLLRITLGTISFFSPGFLYLPGIDLILPGSGPSGEQGTDLRASGLLMGEMAIALLFSSPRFLQKLRQISFIILSAAAVLVGGGRAGFISYLVCLSIAAVYSRRWLLIGGTFIGLFVGIVFLNMNVQSLEVLPPPIQRPFSILIIKPEEATLKTVAILDLEGGTNDWHRQLNHIGFERWTKNVKQFFFGTGVWPFDYSIYKESDGKKRFDGFLIQAANTGYYETGLWPVLACLGLTALLFYILIFGSLLKKIRKLADYTERTRFGKTFVFLSIYYPIKWFLTCSILGTFPSFELMIVGLGLFYLQDAQAEEESKLALE